MDTVTNGNNHNSKNIADSEIEFGTLEHSQPALGLRPDQDRHFSVVSCGESRDGELPIYVDLDVLRDMESHARENTRVELGGVMLGRHHIDQDGNPFVVITDSLRARHYEATKGSFKFTHDTWNQITRERNEFRNDLEMVGWYHTHPGWGVFLSGMDMFICNNFFNRPLDVALVIDPCAGDRGWFQWSATESGKTKQTAGFFLMTNRHRSRELNHFNDIFSNRNAQIHDPRFRQTAFSTDSPHELENTMINLVDNRRPLIELAIVSMLLLQLIVVGLVGWRLTDNRQAAGNDIVDQRLAEIETQMQSDDQRRSASIREQTYAHILDTLVTGETGQGGLVEKYANLATEKELLQENLAGQVSRAKLALQEKEQLRAQLVGEHDRTEKLAEELDLSRKSLDLVKQEHTALKSRLGEGDEDEDQAANLPTWIPYTLVGLGLLIVGGIGGFFLNRIFQEAEEDSYRRSSAADLAANADAANETRSATAALKFESAKTVSRDQ